jgi:flavin reductase (DIM6/NTAB) family NADH-FMN oxidoreductase RutF
VGVKVDSSVHEVIKDSGTFALNVLSKAQQNAAFAFFKTVEADGNSIGGEDFTEGTTGAPIFKSVPAFVECNLVDTVERGDHSIFVGEVVDAGVSQTPGGRLDSQTLMLGDLGDKVYYGG